MDKKALEKRTKDFAVQVARFIGSFSKGKAADVIGYQLMRSGASVGANYREANRAQSDADFVHKMAIVEKEAAESQYWLEILDELMLGDSEERSRLIVECGELVAIFTSAGRTLKARRLKSMAGSGNPRGSSK